MYPERGEVAEQAAMTTAPPVSRQPSERLGPRAERTIAVIIDAAREVFLRFGYAGATIDEIARVAEISRASVYTYFASKREIFFALGAVSSDSTELIALTDSLAAPVDLDQCLRLVDGWFARIDKGADITAIWRDAARDDAEMFEVGRKSFYRLCRLLGTALARHSTAPVEDVTAFGLTILAQVDDSRRSCFRYSDPQLTAAVKRALARQLLTTLTAREPGDLPLDVGPADIGSASA
jgi:AcrR family transcriptional regulator